ncbi:MAG: 4-hydroxy-tetrahydrodipicolinate reductase [Phycisphaerales bacterium]|nr:4-hydroxy-tetrahydrodipicolinate reductase [Phycisphaerales bacterium]
MGSTFTDFVFSERPDRALEALVIGAYGRLGRAIQEASEHDPMTRIHALGRNDPEPGSSVSFDVVINASSVSGTHRAIETALKQGVPIVECVTGHDEKAIAALQNAACDVPVLVAPNTSPGVAVMRELIAQAATRLKGWGVEIREIHHEKKKDQPSGTARFFANEIAHARGEAIPGEAIQSTRTGDVVGEHAVIFGGSHEVIRVEHTANNRVLFGYGALRAARWLVGREAGRYSIADTLAT